MTCRKPVPYPYTDIHTHTHTRDLSQACAISSKNEHNIFRGRGKTIKVALLINTELYIEKKERLCREISLSKKTSSQASLWIIVRKVILGQPQVLTCLRESSKASYEASSSSIKSSILGNISFFCVLQKREYVTSTR